MPLPKSREWLDRFLTGHEPTADELRQLVADCPAEDQWIEYKPGDDLTKPNPGEMLRDYVGGFANADGGALVVGYRESDGTFGARAPGNAPMKDWATRALIPIRTGSTLPEPHFAVTQIDGVEVLIVSVGRARMPVADVRNRAPIFHVRMHDSTVEMPHWLVTDLLLGRRAQPQLSITSHSTPNVRASKPSMNVGDLQLPISLRIENDALQWAESVRAGFVAYSIESLSSAIPASLLQRFDDLGSETFTRSTVRDWRFAHIRSSRIRAQDGTEAPPIRVAPFERAQESLTPWHLPIFPPQFSGLPLVREDDPMAEPLRHARRQARGAIEAQAALYLLAADSEPQWFQLTLRYDMSAAQESDADFKRHVRIEPRVYQRPVVSVRFLDEGEPTEFPE